MATAWELDFEGTTGEGQEQEATVDAPSWYQAVVQDVFEDRKTQDLHFKFGVMDGPFENYIIQDRLTNPANGDTDEKKRIFRNRARLYARRLGLVSEEEKSMFGVDFFDAVGREVWLYVVKQTWKLKDGSGEGSRVGPTFDGIYPIDDPRVQEKMAKQAEEQKGTATGAKAKPVAPAPTSSTGNGAKKPNASVPTAHAGKAEYAGL